MEITYKIANMENGKNQS